MLVGSVKLPVKSLLNKVIFLQLVRFASEGNEDVNLLECRIRALSEVLLAILTGSSPDILLLESVRYCKRDVSNPVGQLPESLFSEAVMLTSWREYCSLRLPESNAPESWFLWALKWTSFGIESRCLEMVPEN